MIAYAGGEQM